MCKKIKKAEKIIIMMLIFLFVFKNNIYADEFEENNDDEYIEETDYCTGDIEEYENDIYEPQIYGIMPMASTYLTTYNSTEYYAESASATYTLSGNIRAYFFSESGFLYINGSGNMPDYAYSSKPPWEGYKEQITDVKIESGITSISSYAFYFYSKLINAEIPDSIIKIGACAFYYCTSLESIGEKLPSSLITVGDSAFGDCGKLELTGSLPEGLTKVERYGFCNCLKIALTGSLPIGLTEIGFSGFYNCKELALSGDIPPSLWKIDDTAFTLCTKITFSGQIPGTLKIIGERAFSGCTEITFSGSLPEGLEKLGWAAFEYCENIALTGALPSTLNEIGSFVFKDCDFEKTYFEKNLSSIDITMSMRIPVKVPIEDRVKTKTGTYLGTRYEYKEVGYGPSYYPWGTSYEGYEYMYPEDWSLKITLAANGGAVPTFYALWDVSTYFTIKIPADSQNLAYSLENDRFEGKITMYAKGRLNANKSLKIGTSYSNMFMWGDATNTRIQVNLYQNILKFVDENPEERQAILLESDTPITLDLYLESEPAVLDYYRGNLYLSYEVETLRY